MVRPTENTARHRTHALERERPQPKLRAETPPPPPPRDDPPRSLRRPTMESARVSRDAARNDPRVQALRLRTEDIRDFPRLLPEPPLRPDALNPVQEREAKTALQSSTTDDDAVFLRRNSDPEVRAGFMREAFRGRSDEEVRDRVGAYSNAAPEDRRLFAGALDEAADRGAVDTRQIGRAASDLPARNQRVGSSEPTVQSAGDLFRDTSNDALIGDFARGASEADDPGGNKATAAFHALQGLSPQEASRFANFHGDSVQRLYDNIADTESPYGNNVRGGNDFVPSREQKGQAVAGFLDRINAKAELGPGDLEAVRGAARIRLPNDDQGLFGSGPDTVSLLSESRELRDSTRSILRNHLQDFGDEMGSAGSARNRELRDQLSGIFREVAIDHPDDQGEELRTDLARQIATMTDRAENRGDARALGDVIGAWEEGYRDARDAAEDKDRVDQANLALGQSFLGELTKFPGGGLIGAFTNRAGTQEIIERQHRLEGDEDRFALYDTVYDILPPRLQTEFESRTNRAGTEHIT